MKPLYSLGNYLRFFWSFLLLFPLTSAAQNVMYLYPEEDAVTTFQFPLQNWGGHTQLSAYAWTQGGMLAKHRSYIKFNLHPLGTMPPLVKATLRLTYYDPVGYPHAGGNAFRVSVADSQWSEYTINWVNQPEGSDVLYVDVPPQSGFQNIDIDVTQLVVHQFHNGNTGFVIQLLEEDIYRMVLFGSRENEGYIPVLELEFIDASSRCDTFYGINGLPTALLNSNQATSSVLNPNHFEVGSIQQPGLTVQRLALQPTLSLLPPSINISHASLRMSIFHPQQVPNIGMNQLRLLPLVVPASLTNLNWNSQPPFNTSVSSMSVSPESNFGVVQFDVKALIEYQFQQGQFTPWLLKKEQEGLTGNSYLAGSGMNMANLSPTLLVCYTTNVGLEEMVQPLQLNVYPNPAKDWLQVQLQHHEGQILTFQIIDAAGRQWYTSELTPAENGMIKWQLQTTEWPNGVYLLRVKSKNKYVHQRFVITR